MAIDLTTKYADRVDERYYPRTVSSFGTNQNYEWDGAKTIKVTSVGVGAMQDYSRTAGYGAVSTAEDLSNSIQTLTINKDRFFRMKLDKLDEEESKIKGGEVLARQLREVTLPEIEAYRLGVMCKAITDNTQSIEETTTPYSDFLAINEKLDDSFVPENTRVAYVTPAFLNAIKKDPAFIRSADISQNILIKGQVGEIDGIPLVKVNAAWLKDETTKYACIIVDKNATVAPLKLAEYQAISNHPDFSGTVFQGRFYYDAFVLEMKKKGLVGIKKK